MTYEWFSELVTMRCNLIVFTRVGGERNKNHILNLQKRAAEECLINQVQLLLGTPSNWN